MSAANPEKSLPGKLAQKARLAGFRKMIEGYIFSMGQQRAAEWYKEQTYISLGFLLFACAHLGIDSCPIEGYDKAKAEKILGLGEMGLQLATIVAIGYRSKEDAHSKDKKVRFERKEVFTEI
jgi:nitroreductase